MEFRINISGTIASLAIGEHFSLPAESYKAGSVRNLAVRASKNGRRYTVKKQGDGITISRIA